MKYDDINHEALVGFYDADDGSLTEDERKQLTPILNSLAHPNILPIHNMGVDPNGKPFFTMELLPGDSLKDIVSGLKSSKADYVSRYSLDALLSIYQKICDAMAYTHSRGVLHLDLKPSNIRVGPFGDVFVCDWGLARIVREADSSETQEPGELDGDELNDFTLSGTLKGTPGFMAPEQASGAVVKFSTCCWCMRFLCGAIPPTRCWKIRWQERSFRPDAASRKPRCRSVWKPWL